MIVAVPGRVTILLVLLQPTAAVVPSWAAWPSWAAVTVTALAVATLVTERRRWIWLLTTGRAHR
ncbi:hypothetical protein [Streptomyces hydrogenans]|uniref:hypothetical protein n=1 Tax=Streptomyces hydrogenans TaxID=1873719 RepID=UPI0037F1989C